jgi:hypothetical protein
VPEVSYDDLKLALTILAATYLLVMLLKALRFWRPEPLWVTVVAAAIGTFGAFGCISLSIINNDVAFAPAIGCLGIGALAAMWRDTSALSTGRRDTDER